MRALLRVTCGLALACALGLQVASSAKLALDPMADDSHAIATAVGQALENADGDMSALLGGDESDPLHRMLKFRKAAKTKQAKKAKAKPSSASSTSVDVKAVTDGKPKQPNCAWQAYVTGNNINAAYPDTQCVYQVLVMIGTTDDKIFRIKGKYPTTGNRYFSLQSNNPKVGFPLATIRDFEITPDAGSGKNPYAEEAAPEEVGTYTVYVTPTGGQGYQNELPLCTEEMSAAECRSVNAVMIMRYYTSDPDQGPLNSETDRPGGKEPRLFGYVGAPKVEVRTRKATPTRKEVWEEFKPCDQSRPTPLTQQIEDNFAKVIPGWDKPRYSDVNDNFIMYLGQDTSSNGVYPNMDANYLSANMWNTAGFLEDGEVLVAKVTGVLPVTAASFTRDPKIPDWQNYEIRYNSFSTLHKTQTAPTLQSLDDSHIFRKYGSRPGWSANRTYSIVAGPSPEATCGLFNAEDDLFLTTKTAEGKIADQWAVLDRQLIPKYTRDGLPDHSITYTRVACSSMSDELACFNPDTLGGLLGNYYPSITWYKCGADGTLRPAFTQTMKEKYFS